MEYGMRVNLWHDICGDLASFPTTGNLLEGQIPADTTREREAIAGEGASRVVCIPLLRGTIGVLKSK